MTISVYIPDHGRIIQLEGGGVWVLGVRTPSPNKSYFMKSYICPLPMSKPGIFYMWELHLQYDCMVICKLKLTYFRLNVYKCDISVKSSVILRGNMTTFNRGCHVFRPMNTCAYLSFQCSNCAQPYHWVLVLISDHIPYE